MDEEFMDDKNSIANLRYNLSYYGADYPVDALVKRMQEQEFIFPNFQRQYVWKIEEASKFIESLLLGLPVPSIFLAKDKYSRKLIVIDGQQRLRTLQFFYNGKFPDGKPFKLKNVIPQVNGFTYQNLASEDRFTLDNTIIHCIIISESDNSDGIFYLFERLNTTGTPLTNQEIRNAIYHGPFNDLLNEFSQSKHWKKLYHKEDIRLEDQELILRFLSLVFELENYNGNLNGFLNEFMLHNRSFERVPKTTIEDVFYGTLKTIFETIGSDAFYHNKLLNRSLFETLCVVLARRKNYDPGKVKIFYKRLIGSDEFWQLSKSATTSRKSILMRVDFANHLFESL